MYTDHSRNPITAMEAVDTLLAPVQAALSGGFQVAAARRYDTSVSLEAYERLAAQYSHLRAVAESGITMLRLKSIKLEMENCRLRAELALRATKG